ncbi:hypothetical protein SG34_014585 [Thalassomonas viridans]|uniref:Uncharacterized protein n=1 Tax=Thalassomonas viridans TaxID=137584 RepID=A0AAE9Z761_9GAMM|nr:hypothetical protein [Thalassomonas viridans]WDE08006.1 hypothetical protein SG34_014585 [Thalassomonas viridans]
MTKDKNNNEISSQVKASQEKSKNQLLWEENSQDIYVIRSAKDDVAYVPYDKYRNAPRLEWYNGEKDQHFCFLTANGYQPENLTGPALTKVIPWNLDTAQPPQSYNGQPLQPGYLLDLRVLHMSRLLNPALEIKMDFKQLPPLKYPIEQSHTKQPEQSSDYTGKKDDGFLPEDKRYQLENVPYDNLYIVSWKDPLGNHKIDEYDPYEITYLTSDMLDECDPAHEVSTGNTMVVLESYFKKAGVQVGALNPKDWEYVSLHGSCYVANLNSFVK